MTQRGFINLKHEGLKPKSIRIALTALVLAWGAYQVFTGAMIFGLIFLAIGAVIGFVFFTDPYFREPPEGGPEN